MKRHRSHQPGTLSACVAEWKRMCCRPYWYNYVNDATTQDVPGELSHEMVEELTYDAGSYYHNTVSKEASWQDPAETGWRAVQDPEGRTFWFHAKVLAALLGCFGLCLSRLLACCPVIQVVLHTAAHCSALATQVHYSQVRECRLERALGSGRSHLLGCPSLLRMETSTTTTTVHQRCNGRSQWRCHGRKPSSTLI